MKRPPPSCPFCGSSATLPFENGESEKGGSHVTEVVLVTMVFFLSLLAILLFFLLSRAGLPTAVLLAVTLFLFWRRRRDQERTEKERPRRHLCLDCNRNFKT